VARDPHLGDEQTAEVGVRNKHLDMPLDQRFQTIAKAIVAEYLRLEVDQNPFVEPLQHGKEKVPLVAEIAIGKTVGYLRDARNVGDRGALIAFFGKSTLGCIEDSVVTILHSFGAYCGHVATPRIFQICDGETVSQPSLRIARPTSRPSETGSIMNIIHFLGRQPCTS